MTEGIPFSAYRTSWVFLQIFLIAVFGCGKEAVREKPTPTVSKPPANSTFHEDVPTETPEAAFAAILQAREKKDWKSVATMLTPESQARMAGSVVAAAEFKAMGGGRKGQELNDLLSRYGVDLRKATDGSPPATLGEAMAELFKSVDDLPTFIGEVAAWLENNGDTESHGGLAEMQSIEEVKVNGDAASAFLQTDRGRFPVEFRSTSGRWLLHFVDDVDAEEPTQKRESARLEKAEPITPFVLLRSIEVEDFDSVEAMSFSPDGRILVTGSDAPRVWGLESPEQPRKYDELNRVLETIGSCHAIAFSADGMSLALGAVDGSVTLLDMSRNGRRLVFDHHSEGIASLAFSPDGKRLLTSSYDGALKLVNAESGDVISDMDTGDDLAVHAVITPDGSGAISVGREVLKWSLSSAEKSHGFGLGKPRQERVDDVAISRDGKLLATAEASPDHSSPAVLIWSVETQELVATLKHRFPQMTVAFSPDGKLLASAGIANPRAHIWRVADGECVQVIEEKERRSIEGVAWSPAGRLAVDCNGMIRIWGRRDAESGRPVPQHAPATTVVSSDVKAEADRVFAAHKRFDATSYEGMMQFMDTGDEPATLTLLVRKEVDGVYDRRAELEIQGKIVLGENGILGYADTFLRLRLVGPNEAWQKIRRKAIIHGRLVIETEENRRLYTLHGISASVYTGFIEEGIKLLDKE